MDSWHLRLSSIRTEKTLRQAISRYDVHEIYACIHTWTITGSWHLRLFCRSTEKTLTQPSPSSWPAATRSVRVCVCVYSCMRTDISMCRSIHVRMYQSISLYIIEVCMWGMRMRYKHIFATNVYSASTGSPTQKDSPEPTAYRSVPHGKTRALRGHEAVARIPKHRKCVGGVGRRTFQPGNSEDWPFLENEVRAHVEGQSVGLGLRVPCVYLVCWSCVSYLVWSQWEVQVQVMKTHSASLICITHLQSVTLCCYRRQETGLPYPMIHVHTDYIYAYEVYITKYIVALSTYAVVTPGVDLCSRHTAGLSFTDPCTHIHTRKHTYTQTTPLFFTCIVLLSVAIVVKKAGLSRADSTDPFIFLLNIVTVRIGSAPLAEMTGLTGTCCCICQWFQTHEACALWFSQVRIIVHEYTQTCVWTT